MGRQVKLHDVPKIVNLLDDPDDTIFGMVVADIMSLGNDAVPLLEDAWYKSKNPTIQKRIELIVQELQHQDAFEGLSRWMKSKGGDILEGAFWVSKYQYPSLSLLKLKRELEQLRMAIWLRLDNDLTPSEQMNTINSVLFDELGFEIELEDVMNPELCYINRLFESKVGNPLTLSILYLSLAQRLDMPLYGVRIPSSFILGYKRRVDKEPLFYINPSNQGKLLQKSDVKRYLKDSGLETKGGIETYSPQQTILHLLEMLAFTYEQAENQAKAEQFRQLYIQFGGADANDTFSDEP